MSLIEKLKSINWLRRLIKRGKIHIEFLHDARDYSKYYLETAEKNGDARYRVSLLVHNLEKGMCREDMRPFGFDKAKRILSILENNKDNDSFEYRLGKSILFSWSELMSSHGWGDKVPEEILDYLKACDSCHVNSGYDIFRAPHFSNETLFDEVILSRRSARDYELRELLSEDVEFATKCFLAAPTACNRQMCHLYQIRDEETKKLLHNSLLGSSGINYKAATYFVITYDIASLEFFGERYQGYVNAGLVSMNFVNGLHSRGIGTCCLQWANKRYEDEVMRHRIGLAKSERIALVIASGYYKEQLVIPHSEKISLNDVFSVV